MPPSSYATRGTGAGTIVHMGPRRRPGFTVIELLVVISITVLLIGILLPQLSRARGAAERSVCLSNLRQVGMALVEYRYNHNGDIPEVQTLPVDPYAPTVMDALAPYSPSKVIWHCPSDRELFGQVGTSYEYFVGFYLTIIDLKQSNKDGKKNDLMQFFERYASKSFIMTDAEGWHPGGPAGSDRDSLFLDGHADWFAIPTGSNSGALNP